MILGIHNTCPNDEGSIEDTLFNDMQTDHELQGTYLQSWG